MLSSDPNFFLKEELFKRLQKAGLFGPFYYAIGLEDSLEDCLRGIEFYPLPEPLDEEKIATFGKSMAFIHEYTHMVQYLGTATGLRYLRQTIIALNRLTKRPLKPPVIEKVVFSNTYEDQQDALRYLSFLETMDQLSIHRRFMKGEMLKKNYSILLENYSPYFHGLPQTDEARTSFEEAAKGSDITFKSLPNLLLQDQEGVWVLTITTALLMEAYAVVVELNHLNNAFSGKLTVQEIFDLLPQEPEYIGLINYAINEGVCESGSFLPIIICIDLALMYDPFTLYNINTVSKAPESEIEDFYPGKTFLDACEASKNLVFESHEKAGLFYKQLCDEMGIPDPLDMAKAAFEKADELLKRADKDALFSGPLKMHRNVLEKRLQDPYNFPVMLTRRDSVWELFEIISTHTSFFQVHDRVPVSFYQKNIGILTFHNMLLQALSTEKIECPLKMGIPFYCDVKRDSPNKLCAWQSPDGIYECHLDIFERMIGFVVKE